MGCAMKCLGRTILRFLIAEDGPTAVEYAIMLMLVFLACLSVVVVLGQSASTSFEDSSTSIEEAFDGE